MATNTTYYSLIKPDEEDFYDVQEFNKNADIVDRELRFLLSLLMALDVRVTRLENLFFESITENPFLVSFESLDGITLRQGIWNEGEARAEC